MAKNYKEVSYFQDRPDVVKIFDDLEAFKNFCRLEMCNYDEANLYNRSSDIWNKFYFHNKPKKNKDRRDKASR